MLNTILILIWLVLAVPMSIFNGVGIYRQPVKPPPFSGQLRGGNKRSAVLCGLLFGAMWPVHIAIVLVIVFLDWVAAGGKANDKTPAKQHLTGT